MVSWWYGMRSKSDAVSNGSSYEIEIAPTSNTFTKGLRRTGPASVGVPTARRHPRSDWRRQRRGMSERRKE
jgi:hypothetical protein